MLLPMFEGLVKTSPADPEMAALADRHYSRRTVGSPQFADAGRKLVLRDGPGDVLFVWIWMLEQHRKDGQVGYCCSIFRNEGPRLSSEVILEAEREAFGKWGPNRVFTFVNPRKIRSTNPGACFKHAGWRKVGESKRGLHVLAKEAA
jgi:hypothetical protein